MPFSKLLFRTSLSPLSLQPDARRQEFIFNIIVFSLFLASVLASLIVTVNVFSESIDHFGGTFIITWAFTLGLSGLLALSRSGRARAAIVIFVGLLALVTVQLIVKWGFMLPTALLLTAMIVVISGVLLGARYGLWFALIATIFILVMSYLQQQNIIDPDTRWLKDDFHVGDAVGYVLLLLIIGVVSWLSNREIDRSLQRARASEKALAAERDSLELKVVARTRELEETQLVRLMELQRFAAFGRLSANLLHEIANPLTAVSLNLELMDPAQSALVNQARSNLKHLERYVQAARQQIRGSTVKTVFSVNKEINQLLRLLSPRAADQQVTIEYRPTAPYRLFGDPVKFSQLIGNLVANAVDAYTDSSSNHKLVLLIIAKNKERLVITVRDNGTGLTKDMQLKIFEPFYTTKHRNGRSLGIGLALVQQFVEQDFGGSINVTSTKSGGTTFEVILKAHGHGKR